MKIVKDVSLLTLHNLYREVEALYRDHDRTRVELGLKSSAVTEAERDHKRAENKYKAAQKAVKRAQKREEKATKANDEAQKDSDTTKRPAAIKELEDSVTARKLAEEQEEGFRVKAEKTKTAFEEAEKTAEEQRKADEVLDKEAADVDAESEEDYTETPGDRVEATDPLDRPEKYDPSTRTNRTPETDIYDRSGNLPIDSNEKLRQAENEGLYAGDRSNLLAHPDDALRRERAEQDQHQERIGGKSAGELANEKAAKKAAEAERKRRERAEADEQ